MLPFLKRKEPAGTAVTIHRKPDEPKDEQHQGLEACAKDLIDAIKSEDASRVSQALKDAFAICESYPDEEGPEMDEMEPGE